MGFRVDSNCGQYEKDILHEPNALPAKLLDVPERIPQSERVQPAALLRVPSLRVFPISNTSSPYVTSARLFSAHSAKLFVASQSRQELTLLKS